MALHTLTCGHIARTADAVCQHASHGAVVSAYTFDADALADRVQRWQARENVRMAQQHAELVGGAQVAPRHTVRRMAVAVVLAVVALMGMGAALAPMASAADAPLISRGERVLHVAPVVTGTPSGHCEASVYLTEDGTWRGGALVDATGAMVWHDWHVAPVQGLAYVPRMQSGGWWGDVLSYGTTFPAMVGTDTCTLVDAHTLAPLPADVLVFEDGSWGRYPA